MEIFDKIFDEEALSCYADLTTDKQLHQDVYLNAKNYNVGANGLPICTGKIIDCILFYMFVYDVKKRFIQEEIKKRQIIFYCKIYHVTTRWGKTFTIEIDLNFPGCHEGLRPPTVSIHEERLYFLTKNGKELLGQNDVENNVLSANLTYIERLLEKELCDLPKERSAYEPLSKQYMDFLLRVFIEGHDLLLTRRFLNIASYVSSHLSRLRAGFFYRCVCENRSKIRCRFEEFSEFHYCKCQGNRDYFKKKQDEFSTMGRTK